MHESIKALISFINRKNAAILSLGFSIRGIDRLVFPVFKVGWSSCS